ncbi:MAG: efflux RND transporter periplasmic adaptor subunit [Janthinobacterium lividum]
MQSIKNKDEADDMILFQHFAADARIPARFALCIGPVLLLLGLGGCVKHGVGAPANAAPANAAPATEVGVLVVTPQKIVERTELPGRLSAFDVADVRPQISGIVQKRLFTEGAEVAAGQPLYQIDSAMYRAAYDQARGVLAKAQGVLANAKAKSGRYEELIKIKAISKQDQDDALAAVTEDQGDLIADQAALETARINLSYTRITSPIAGRIGKSSVTTGALVTADQTSALATVQSIDRMYLDVSRPSADWLKLRREFAAGRLKRVGKDGASVNLVMEDGSAYPQAGTLAFSDITVDPTTGSVTLRVIVPNPEHNLLPGMFVRAELDEGVNDTAMLVPQLAVARSPDGGASAWVVAVDGKAHLVPVKADTPFGDQWIVTAGLKSGDRVVISGASQLQDGAPVKIAQSRAATPTLTSAAPPAAPPVAPPASGVAVHG